MPFSCPYCGMTSHHPKDEEHSYCAMCDRQCRPRDWKNRPKPLEYTVANSSMFNEFRSFLVFPVYHPKDQPIHPDLCEHPIQVFLNNNDVIRFQYENGVTKQCRLEGFPPEFNHPFYAYIEYTARYGQWDLGHKMLQVARDTGGGFWRYVPTVPDIILDIRYRAQQALKEDPI